MKKVIVYSLDDIVKAKRIKMGKEESKRMAKRRSREKRIERKEFGEELE
jgi:hypothetical protein